MSDYETTGDLNEAIYYERLEVDREMAGLEAAGNAYAKDLERSLRLKIEGRLWEAAMACPHGHVGGLDGSCTDNDPRHGEEGYRCFECGAHVTDLGGEVINID